MQSSQVHTTISSSSTTIRAAEQYHSSTESHVASGLLKISQRPCPPLSLRPLPLSPLVLVPLRQGGRTQPRRLDRQELAP